MSGTTEGLALDSLDPVLAGRLQRLAQVRGWSPQQTLVQALERGLLALEGETSASLEADEADVLKEAIAALEQIPDSAFAAIGKAPPPPPGEDDV